MALQPETPAGPLRRRAVSGIAFGLALEVDPAIEIPGIAGAPSDLPHLKESGPPTRVRLDPQELERRWDAVAGTAERVRELRDGQEVLLSVEHAAAAGYLVHAPGFGRILVSEDGAELICDPLPGSAEWAMLLPAQALPLAATLRGFEVLHASGVVLAGRALLFAGPPGAGKSSLAAALLRRGADLLSDDAVALTAHEGTLIALPGAALLHLRAAEHARLSTSERDALGPPVRFLGKRRYTPVTASPAPVGELFLLERSNDEPSLERIEAVDPFALLASTYNLSVRTGERLARHLDLAVSLAATEHVYRLRIQPDIDASRLAEIVEQQLAERS